MLQQQHRRRQSRRSCLISFVSSSRPKRALFVLFRQNVSILDAADAVAYSFICCPALRLRPARYQLPIPSLCFALFTGRPEDGFRTLDCDARLRCREFQLAGPQTRSRWCLFLPATHRLNPFKAVPASDTPPNRSASTAHSSSGGRCQPEGHASSAADHV